MTGRVVTRIVIGGVLLAALGTTACSTGSSGSNSASTSTAEDTTLQLYNQLTSIKTIDTPPKGPSLGDVTIVNGILHID